MESSIKEGGARGIEPGSFFGELHRETLFTQATVGGEVLCPRVFREHWGDPLLGWMLLDPRNLAATPQAVLGSPC